MAKPIWAVIINGETHIQSGTWSQNAAEGFIVTAEYSGTGVLDSDKSTINIIGNDCYPLSEVAEESTPPTNAIWMIEVP